jgi:hypothetical protein
LTGWQSFQRALIKATPTLYFLLAFLITIGISAAMVFKAHNDGLSQNILIVVSILSLIVVSHFALALVNWWSTVWIKPKHLPKMNFSKGIPSQYRTMVAVPSIIVDHKQAEKLVEDLEVRYLANKDPNLLFALLTDFADSEEPALFEDDGLIAHVQQGIETLNKKYGRLTADTFFLFHRPRQWNAKQNKWMG